MHTCDHLHENDVCGDGLVMGRRDFLRIATLGGGATLLFSAAPAAASGAADALLLSCMDYRLVDDLTRYMDSRGLTNKYDHVVLAGASAGAIHEKFKDWHPTFWGHLKVAIELHKIRRVIVIDHRDCGAYKIAFGAEHAADPDVEAAVHGTVLARLAKQIVTEYPSIAVETLLMAVDGRVSTISASGACEPQSKSQAKAKPQPEESHEELAANGDGPKLDGGSLFSE